MSHWSTTKSEMKEIEVLHDACNGLGLIIATNTNVRGYAGSQQKADLVVSLNRYDIGFVVGKDGKIEVLMDKWGVNQEQMVKELVKNFAGEPADALLSLVERNYAAQVIKRKARLQGLVGGKMNVTADGKIEISYSTGR